jgi:glutathione S-transferase
MGLTIYGIPRSRAIRPVWVAEELGIPYTLVPINWADKATHTPAFKAANPLGRIPAIDDDGYMLFESVAINCYLARKHPGLWPKTLGGEGKLYQWSLFAVTELETPVTQIFYHTRMLPEAERKPEVVPVHRAALVAPLSLLADTVAKSPYLVEDTFTLADLNVAQMLLGAYINQLDIGMPPAVMTWLDTVFARPAAQKIIAMRKA